jgi:hypothetical protein
MQHRLKGADLPLRARAGSSEFLNELRDVADAGNQVHSTSRLWAAG